MKNRWLGVVLLLIVLIAGIVLTARIWGNKLVVPETQTTVQASEAFFPAPTNYAVDAAGVLTPEQLATLNDKLKALDNDKHQFGVAVVKTTAPLDIDQYGIQLVNTWKAGDKNLDNGAVIIIATEDRKVRIEVGYGLEGDIPDAAAGRIIDMNMIPSLKSGDWYGAIIGGLDGLNNAVK